MVDMVDRGPRSKRELETRAATPVGGVRWRKPDVLPEPPAADGFEYRWCRTSVYGVVDAKNVSAKFREHWIPVKLADFPEFASFGGPEARGSGNVEMGGLILCRRPKEIGDQRRQYYANLTRQQLVSLQTSYLNDTDRFSKRSYEVIKDERVSTGIRFGQGN